VDTEQAAPRRRLEALAETLRKFLRRGARANVSKLLARTRPEDVAILLRGMPDADRLELFRLLVAEFPVAAGVVLTEIEPPQRQGLLEALTPEEIAAVLEHSAVDDTVFLVDSLPPELHDRVLEIADKRELAEVQTQLTYLGDTAGRIMNTEFFALAESTTVRQAIDAIQQTKDVEMIFYLYVTDRDGHLVGVTSLRQLLMTPPDRTLGAIMNRSVIKAHTDTDQEEVAQVAARYDLLAIPVTDAENHLVGIVTVDDIIDIVKEEATEDFYKMVGTSDAELLYQEQPLKVARIRLPWLMVNLVGLILSGLLLKHFQVTLREALFLLTFVPVVMGMGGSIGSQTSTIAVRALAAGRLGKGPGGLRHFLGQQVLVGAILGLAVAVVVGVVAWVLEANPYYALVAGGAVLLTIVVAASNGVLVPIVFRRLGIDPALSTGPLVTTVNDLTGILIFFTLASLLIDFLVR
jgi:magnesium transporter